MPKKVFSLYRFTPDEAHEAALQLSPRRDPNDRSDDFQELMNADFALGIAGQDFCNTRDELIAFAREAQLLPYLEDFLARRGWLDDDWRRRIALAAGLTPAE
jgi:hypothetical protein